MSDFISTGQMGNFILNMTRPAKDCHVQVCKYHCLSHTSCVLSCSLFYCISGLFADMGGIVISCDSEVKNC